MNKRDTAATVIRSIRLPGKLANRLQKISDAERRSFNKQVQIMLEDGAESWEQEQEEGAPSTATG